MEWIKVQRLKANLSQVELAAKLHITQPAVARLEMPGTYPKAGKLPEIADALSCSIDALFGRSPPPASQSYHRKEAPVHVPDQAELNPKSADQ